MALQREPWPYGYEADGKPRPPPPVYIRVGVPAWVVGAACLGMAWAGLVLAQGF